MQARVESPIVRDILELAPSNFIDAKEDVLMLGPPGVGTSHRAKALALFSVQRSDKVIYREAHTEVLMSRYEKHPPSSHQIAHLRTGRSCSVMSCSSRLYAIDSCTTATYCSFEGESWRLTEAAASVAKPQLECLKCQRPVVGEFDPAMGGGISGGHRGYVSAVPDDVGRRVAKAVHEALVKYVTAEGAG